MAATVSYGSWAQHTNTSSVEDYVRLSLAGKEQNFKIDSIVTEFRRAINLRLPGGMSLGGNEFFGPEMKHGEEAGRNAGIIARTISDIDFWSIVQRYAK